jgi:hypothetical protein
MLGLLSSFRFHGLVHLRIVVYLELLQSPLNIVDFKKVLTGPETVSKSVLDKFRLVFSVLQS